LTSSGAGVVAQQHLDTTSPQYEEGEQQQDDVEDDELRFVTSSVQDNGADHESDEAEGG
jgi:hypothetical protein